MLHESERNGRFRGGDQKHSGITADGSTVVIAWNKPGFAQRIHINRRSIEGCSTSFYVQGPELADVHLDTISVITNTRTIHRHTPAPLKNRTTGTDAHSSPGTT